MPAEDGSHTLEQVWSLIERLRAESGADLEKLEVRLSSAITRVETKLDARAQSHDTRHEEEKKSHAAEHKSDRAERRGLILWAVTTIMTGIGTGFAIIWALTHSG